MNTQATNEVMTAEALAKLGAPEMVYIRPVTGTEVKADAPEETESVPDEAVLYAVHAADGTRMAVLDNREAAFTAARQNDMVPVSVH